MAVVVTYQYPLAGLVAAVPPVSSVDSCNATVIEDAGAAVAVTITHNMGLSAADLASGFPIVDLVPLLADARASLWIVTAKTANNIEVTKAASVGNGAAQLAVHIRRPHSIGQ